MYHIVYKITNLVNDKIYVGKHSTNKNTRFVYERFYKHVDKKS